MKNFIYTLLLIVPFLLVSCKEEDQFVVHDDLPDNIKRVYLFVQDSETHEQIEGAEIKFLTPKGSAFYEAMSKPDKPWDFLGTKTPSIDFHVHNKTVEITKAGYEDFSMDFESIPSVEKAKNSFELYARLKKTP